MVKNFFRRILEFSQREEQLGEIIALHEYKALYFAIPKVACSSLKSLCVDLLHIDLPADAWKPELFHTTKFDHLINKDEILICKSSVSRYSDYWRFAFVRNPWDRLVSCYSEKIRDDGDPENFINGVSKVLIPYGVFRAGMSFADFVHAVVAIPDEEAEPHIHSQYTFITDKNGNYLVDFVGRFENLENDFRQVCEILKVSSELPHLLPSKRKAYKDYYNKQLIELVARRYHKDIELFDYKFE